MEQKTAPHPNLQHPISNTQYPFSEGPAQCLSWKDLSEGPAQSASEGPMIVSRKKICIDPTPSRLPNSRSQEPGAWLLGAGNLV